MLPDPIERMEARIDELIFEQFAGVPNGQIRCHGCKKLVPVDQVDSVSPRPDAAAYCWECLDDVYPKDRM